MLADFGIPRSVLVYVNYPTHFDSRQTQAALEGTGISVPPLQAYAGKLWDYWERHLDPDLFRDRTLLGAARGRLGLIGGLAQILEQQIPDELLRFGRSLRRQRLARGGRPRPGRHGHRRLVGDRQVGGAEDRRRRRHRAARRPHAGEARG